jgi:hypothetical protein
VSFVGEVRRIDLERKRKERTRKGRTRKRERKRKKGGEEQEQEQELLTCIHTALLVLATGACTYCTTSVFIHTALLVYASILHY